MTKRSFNTLLALCSISIAVSAASSSTPITTTTLTAPTKTYCPQFYTTTKSPKPTDYTCGEVGTLATRDEISRHCYEDYNYGLSDHPPTETDCYRSCSNEPRCISYAWDFYEQICYLYGKALIDMGFRIDSNSSQTHWNLRGCHVCEAAPLPARPGCPEVPVGKSANQTVGYFCSSKGVAEKSYDDYISGYVGFLLQNPNITDCYRKCRRYQAYGACEAWVYTTGDFTHTPGCDLLTRPLRDFGWNTSAPDGEFLSYGTNLRGCYDCNSAPTTTYPDGCSPTPHTVAPVLKNGDFSRTVFSQIQNATVPAFWQPSSEKAVSSKTSANGNVFVSFRVEIDSPFTVPYIAGTAANFSRNPYTDSRFYNVTFDLALPRFNRTGVSACSFFLGNWLNRAKIDLFTVPIGTTFRKMGPYLYDTTITLDPPSFGMFCQSGQGKVEVWLDNVQITQRGRVVAGAGTGQ